MYMLLTMTMAYLSVAIRSIYMYINNSVLWIRLVIYVIECNFSIALLAENGPIDIT